MVQAENVAGRFVVSIVGRSRTRTLHRVGECHIGNPVYTTLNLRYWEMNLPMQLSTIGLAEIASAKMLLWQ